MKEITEEQILWKALKYACGFESNYSTKEIETNDLANYYYQRAKADLLEEKTDELMEKIDKVKYARKLLAKRLISECKTYQTSEKEEAWPIYLEGDGYSDGQLVYDEAFCPACDYLLTDEYDPATEYEPYCPHCGHRISWNEFKEEIGRLCEEKREENE